MTVLLHYPNQPLQAIEASVIHVWDQGDLDIVEDPGGDAVPAIRVAAKRLFVRNEGAERVMYLYTRGLLMLLVKDFRGLWRDVKGEQVIIRRAAASAEEARTAA